jgi:hypothetical protein
MYWKPAFRAGHLVGIPAIYLSNLADFKAEAVQIHAAFPGRFFWAIFT